MNQPDSGTCTILTREQLDALCSLRIRDLGLKIPGSRLAPLIRRLFQELDCSGISFRPAFYLSDEWGCPHGSPAVGIPFYLADLRLCELEGDLTGIEAETDAEVMMYLRHETGHAFNYAHHLYARSRWRELFGLYSRPYDDEYRPIPFSTGFVRHIPGWYAQKHPDDDFAETFAVWLTPGAKWESDYAGTPALAKLRYVQGLVRRIGRAKPVVTEVHFDAPIEELNTSLGDWYFAHQQTTPPRISLPEVIDQDLRRLFPDPAGRPAGDFMRERTRHLIREVNNWTGIERHILGGLVRELTRRVLILDLRLEPDRIEAGLMGLTAFVTTLAMNYQATGQFVRTK